MLQLRTGGTVLEKNLILLHTRRKQLRVRAPKFRVPTAELVFPECVKHDGNQLVFGQNLIKEKGCPG